MLTHRGCCCARGRQGIGDLIIADGRADAYCPRSFNWNGDSKKNPSTCTSIGSSMRTPTTPPIFSVTVNELPAMAERVGVASTTAPLTRYETAVGATCTSSVFTALPLESGFLIA